MSSTTSSKTSLRIWIGGIFLIGVALVSILLMTARRNHTYADDTKDRLAAEKAGPIVNAVVVGQPERGKEMVLIGEARPFLEVTLYAKIGGYMDKILVDKGDRVHEGQLLATLVSPETDQAYAAALADLENKRKILARDSILLQKEYIAPQDEQQEQTDVNVAAANVESLRQQRGYENLTAPFDGTVTARFADPGALVQNAVSAETSAQPVVTVSELDRIRVYVYVEQAVADYLKDGYPVSITKVDKPADTLKGTITRLAGELDPKTRMMLVEIDLPNRDQQVIPGSYVNVHIQEPQKQSAGVQVPSDAIVLKDGKYTIPVIQADSTLRYQEVKVGDNDGQQATILGGIQKGDLIGINVGPGFNNGQKVRIKS